MKKSGRHRPLFLFFVIAIFLSRAVLAQETELRVIVQKANIRAQPDRGSAIVLQVSAGAVLKSDRREGDWYRVLLPPDENGVVKGAFIHHSIVEVLSKPREPETEPPKEPEKKEARAEDELIPEEGKTRSALEPKMAKQGSSFFNGLLRNMKIKLSSGPGWLLSGAGDLENLRVGTEDVMDAYGSLPDHESFLEWNKLSFNYDFKLGIDFNVTPLIGVGIHTGYISASNKNISYSIEEESATPPFSMARSAGASTTHFPNFWGGQNVYGKTLGTFGTERISHYSRDFSISAVPFSISLFFPAASCGARGRFSPYGYFDFGLYFGRGTQNFALDQTTREYFESEYFTDHEDIYSWQSSLSERWKSTAFGIEGGLGISYALTPRLSVGAELYGRFVNFKNWKGTQAGSWASNFKSYNEEDGWYADESDSGSWDLEGKLWWYEYRDPHINRNVPEMGIVSNEPNGLFENVFPAALNLNSMGIRLIADICLSGPKKDRPQAAPSEKTGERTKKSPPKKKRTKKSREPSPPTNPYSNFQDENCSCPCCIGLEVYLLVEVEVGGWISVFKDIVSDEFKFGNTEGDFSVEHKRERTIQVDFDNKKLDNWQRNRVRITVETKANFDREIPEYCCVAGEGSFAGSATIITDDVTDTTGVPRPTRRNRNPRLTFVLGSCTGGLCCRVTFKPYQLKKSYKLGPLPRINLDGWIFTQVSTYLNK